MNKGIAHPFLIFAVIFLGFIGIGVYFVLYGGTGTHATTPCDPKQPKVLESDNYYGGKLIDTHIHMPTGSNLVTKIAGFAGFPSMPVLGKDLNISQVNCLLENESITKAFGFYLVPKYATGPSLRNFKNNKSDKVAPFFMPPPVKALNISASSTRRKIEDNKDFFAGIGELPLYQDSYGDVSPDDEYFVDLYKIAQDNGLVVMIHVSEAQQTAAEKIVSDFPDVNFLFHGEDYVNWIVEMMNKYDNFYYSLDANVAELYSLREDEHESEITVEQYVSHIKNNLDEVLARQLSLWQKAIETHPDRFMWGTDRWFVWTYDPKVGAALTDFGRIFIANLETSAQEPFAFKNAETLLNHK